MDDETDTGTYNPDLADTGVSGGTQMPGSEGAAQGDDSMDALPTPPDEGSREETKSLWRSIMDAARKQFGIADANANAAVDKDTNTDPNTNRGEFAQRSRKSDQIDHAPAGLPKQAGEEQDEIPGQPDEAEPAGLPVQAAAVRPPDGKNPQRIIQYVTGHGAEDNDATKAREQKVEAELPQGTGKDDVRTEALRQNMETNGPEGAVAQWQAHKAQYNKYKVLAGAAQDHGDNDTAAQLFNEAHTYLPNGVKVTASPGSGGGMNIHISDPTGGSGSGTGGTPAQDIKLTGDQFRELTHMRVGEFDHVLERGITKNLTDLAKTPGMSTAPGQQAQAQPQTQTQQNKPGRDQSPEARANRVYPWVSQGKQRELLAEQYRREDQKEKNTTRTLDIKEKEVGRKEAYGVEKQATEREKIAQKDRWLGYLIDKSTGELNERMLNNLDRANGANISNAVRSIDANIRAGNPLTDSDKAVLDRARSLAMTPAARPSTLNGGGQTPPASGRGVAPPSGSTAPPPGQDPRGRWQINTATQQRRWVPYQQ